MLIQRWGLIKAMFKLQADGRWSQKILRQANKRRSYSIMLYSCFTKNIKINYVSQNVNVNWGNFSVALFFRKTHFSSCVIYFVLDLWSWKLVFYIYLIFAMLVLEKITVSESESFRKERVRKKHKKEDFPFLVMLKSSCNNLQNQQLGRTA